MPIGKLQYHLDYLVKREVITKQSDARYARYYVSGKLTSQEKRMIFLLRQRMPRRIVIHILLNPNSRHKEILSQFKIAKSTLSFHLRNLVKADILEQHKNKSENTYSVREPNLVASLLITYKPSFFDDAVDRFAELWVGL